MAALLEAGGDLRVATETVRLIIAADPTGDHGNAALMRLYALDGRRADALRHYGHFQQLLEQELGIEPGLATQRLYDEIRTGTLSALGPRRRCATGSATPRRCQAVPLSRQGVRPGARR
jgi:DNA-binding SARP family transcriptional activator